jgi:uncharacterized delta-60 repeat protein
MSPLIKSTAYRSSGGWVVVLTLIILLTCFAGEAQSQRVFLEWDKNYDTPNKVSWERLTDLAVDPAGNVYVTGWVMDLSTSPPPTDMLTIKYSPQGIQEWVRKWGDANKSEGAKCLQVDPQGNIVVAGLTSPLQNAIIIKYDSNGAELWKNPILIPVSEYGMDMKVDSQGSVYFGKADLNTVTLKYSFAVSKYTSNGTLVWAKKSDSVDHYLELAAMAVDGAGCAYLTGWLRETSDPHNDKSDFFTVKLKPNGDQAWKATYGNPGLNDTPCALAVDAGGYVNVAGTSETQPTNDQDFTLIKYTPTGSLLWGKHYNSPFNDIDAAKDLVVDSQGCAYVTGECLSYSYVDYLTVKYSPGGTLLWFRFYNGLGNNGSSYDTPSALALDRQGNVYVTGHSDEKFEYGNWSLEFECFTTLKYTRDGDPIWRVRQPAFFASSTPDILLAVDARNRVYVAGSVKDLQGGDPYEDFYTLKYRQASLPPLELLLLH